jgi:hypothetical protein
VPLRTIAQLTSTPVLVTHQAAVLDPRPEPTETHRSGRARTRTWPSLERPTGVPRIRTNVSLASVADASGQGWPVRHDPSISRAAIPERRSLGPSAHQTGPSPSHTRTGVHVKRVPAATILVRSKSIVGRYDLSGMSQPRAASD